MAHQLQELEVQVVVELEDVTHVVYPEQQTLAVVAVVVETKLVRKQVEQVVQA